MGLVSPQGVRSSAWSQNDLPAVRELAAEHIPVAVTCRVLGFTTRAFYKWQGSPVSQRDWDDGHRHRAAQRPRPAGFGRHGRALRPRQPAPLPRLPAHAAPYAAPRLDAPVGTCGDNAAVESFFSLLQKNVLNRQRWQTREELRLAIVVWMQRTYHAADAKTPSDA